MMRMWIGIALACACVGINAGCDKVASAVQQAQRAAEAKPLFDGDGASTALAALRRAASGGGTAPTLQCLSIAVYPDRAEYQFESPAKAGNVDEYRYERAGVVSGPFPVRLVGSGDLQTNLFPCDAVKLDALSGLFAEALKRTALEEGKVTYLTIRREFNPISADTRRKIAELEKRSGIKTGALGAHADEIPDGTVVMHVSVTGTRRQATLTADANGHIIKVTTPQ
jgi:hypothetical protein